MVAGGLLDESGMVTGLDKFREYFAEHEDQYVIIGGAACHLLFDEAGLEFKGNMKDY